MGEHRTHRSPGNDDWKGTEEAGHGERSRLTAAGPRGLQDHAGWRVEGEGAGRSEKWEVRTETKDKQKEKSYSRLMSACVICIST